MSNQDKLTKPPSLQSEAVGCISNDLIDELHVIVNNEASMLESASPGFHARLMNFIVGFNTAGIFGDEVFDALKEQHVESEDWWRFWGSVSQNFRMVIRNHGWREEEFSKSFIGLNSIILRSIPKSSFTIADRIQGSSYREADGERDISHPADFWIICALLFRLTVHRNELVKNTLYRYIDKRDLSMIEREKAASKAN